MEGLVILSYVAATMLKAIQQDYENHVYNFTLDAACKMVADHGEGAFNELLKKSMIIQSGCLYNIKNEAIPLFKLSEKGFNYKVIINKR